jgi:hypothetical protein
MNQEDVIKASLEQTTVWYKGREPVIPWGNMDVDDKGSTTVKISRCNGTANKIVNIADLKPVESKTICLECEELNERIEPIRLRLRTTFYCNDCLRKARLVEQSIDTPQSSQVTLNDHDKKVEDAIDALKAIDFVNNLGDEQLLRQLLFTYVGRS